MKINDANNGSRTMRITSDNIQDVRGVVNGTTYSSNNAVLAQFDWLGYYPVVCNGVVVDVAPADSTDHDIVDDAYMVSR